MSRFLSGALFFARRAGAFFVDGILVFSVATAIFFGIYGPMLAFSDQPFSFQEMLKISRLSSEWLQWTEAGIELMIYVGYFSFFHARFGATPGKRIFGLRVVDDLTGELLSIRRSMGRFVAYFFSAAPFGTGFLMALFHPRQTALHDWVVGSKVISAKSKAKT